MRGRFKSVIGIGGIGTGSIWYLSDDRILSKDESRPARLSDARDYCKQHIILHYIAVAMAPTVRIYPIGLVGEDAAGARLVEMMRGAGMDTCQVRTAPKSVTTQSVCMHYPDQSVCNITAVNGACEAVDAEYVGHCLGELGGLPDQDTLILAAPEVSLDARLALLRSGSGRGAYRVVSVNCEEAARFRGLDGLSACELLVINEEEALALTAGEGVEEGAENAVAEAVGRLILRYNPSLSVVVTRGGKGAMLVTRDGVSFQPASKVQVVSTAGAGDAFTAGVVFGLHLGLPLMARDDGMSAMKVGGRFASRAVQCIDTIDESLTPKEAQEYAGIL